jgi:predicted Zn-dependent protease
LYVSGTISLDGPQFAESPSGTRAVQAAIIKHELGHLLGLNHVDDPTQLVYKEAIDTSAYGVEDLNGLAHLGTGHCFPDL